MKPRAEGNLPGLWVPDWVTLRMWVRLRLVAPRVVTSTFGLAFGLLVIAPLIDGDVPGPAAWAIGFALLVTWDLAATRRRVRQTFANPLTQQRLEVCEEGHLHFSITPLDPLPFADRPARWLRYAFQWRMDYPGMDLDDCPPEVSQALGLLRPWTPTSQAAEARPDLPREDTP